MDEDSFGKLLLRAERKLVGLFLRTKLVAE
jgi:hypothetical protein